MLLCASAKWVVDLINLTWIVFLLDRPTHPHPIYYVWLQNEYSQYITNSVQHHRSQALAWICDSPLPTSKWLVVKAVRYKWVGHAFTSSNLSICDPSTRSHSIVHLPMRWNKKGQMRLKHFFTLIHAILMLCVNNVIARTKNIIGWFV